MPLSYAAFAQTRRSIAILAASSPDVEAQRQWIERVPARQKIGEPVLRALDPQHVELAHQVIENDRAVAGPHLGGRGHAHELGAGRAVPSAWSRLSANI
jgi:hypothetical protein